MAALVVAGLGGLAPLEHRLMDLRFELLQRPASGDLVVVEVDSASLTALGVWPWPRDLHAALIDRLLAAGARWRRLRRRFQLRLDTAADAALAGALARGRRVVLPVFKQYGSLARRDDDLRYTAPLPMFSAHSPLASVNLQPGENGQVRLYTLAEPWEGNLYPSVGAAFAAVERPRADDFYLDYGIRAETLPQVSFADVLQGRVDSVLRGKLVIVGATAIELGDLASVPVYRTLPGVIVQALGYESIAQGRMLLRTSPVVTWGVALLLALVAGSRFARWPWRGGLLAALVGSGALIGLGLVLQAAAPISLDIVVWIIVLWVSYLAALMQGTDALAVRIFRKGMALLHHSATMRAVLDDSFDGIIIADEAGRIEHVNVAAAAMLGEEAAALFGRPSPACSGSSCRPQTRPAARGPRSWSAPMGRGSRSNSLSAARGCAAAGTVSNVATRRASSRSGPSATSPSAGAPRKPRRRRSSRPSPPAAPRANSLPTWAMSCARR
jgi:CHASE2 domain-containing sensor protein